MRNQLPVILFSLFLLLIRCSPDKKGTKITESNIAIENILPFQPQHCHGSSIVELPNNDLLVACSRAAGNGLPMM